MQSTHVFGNFAISNSVQVIVYCDKFLAIIKSNYIVLKRWWCIYVITFPAKLIFEFSCHVKS